MDVKEYYDRDAIKYDLERFKSKQGRIINKIEIELVLNILKPEASEKILEIGCGTGRFLEKVATTGCNLWGIDISENMISKAKEKIGNRKNVKFIKGDIYTLDSYELKFDKIYSIHVLEHLKNFDIVLDLIYTLLNKNGVVIFDYPNKWSYSRFVWRIKDKIWGERVYTLTKSPWTIINKLEDHGFEVTSTYGQFIIHPRILPIYTCLNVLDALCTKLPSKYLMHTVYFKCTKCE